MSFHKYLLIMIACAGCESANLSPGTDAGNGCSPSGYSCDPWSTHLYLSSSLTRQGNSLRLSLMHNPDYEGSADDQQIPPEHDFFQQLTVDIPLTSDVKHFLCVVFSPQSGASAVDASQSSFLTDVDSSSYGLLMGSSGTATVVNLVDICGSPQLASVYAPSIARNNRPALADVGLMIPLAPKPTDFVAGTKFSGWLGRGILYVDEQAELTPPLFATVVSVQ